MSKLCSIFFYEGYVGVSPTIVNISKLLDKSEHLVTIYALQNSYPQPGKLGERTDIIYLEKASDVFLLSKLFKFLIKIKLGSLVTVLELGSFVFQCFIHLLQNYQRETSREDFSIGVDTNGSIVALLKFYLFKQKFIYLSLELNHPTRFRKISRIIGMLERLAYRKSECVIIQDQDRFETICEYLNYQHHNVFYLPNSACSSDSITQNTGCQNYLRAKFNLSKEHFPYIILHAGMINDAVFSKMIAHTFNFIERGALIMHEREKRSFDDPYIKLLQKINNKNLFLSLDPLPYDEIDKVYESATIGLAFYANLDSNFAKISMASGKLSYYLKHGKPVLLSNLKSLSQLVEKYKIGVVIKDLSDQVEIRAAIKLILGSYDFYSENAKSCFQAEFDFNEKIKPILSFMKKL